MKIISKCFGIYDSKCWNQQATLWTTTTHTYSDLFSMNNFCFAIYWIFFFALTRTDQNREEKLPSPVSFFSISHFGCLHDQGTWRMTLTLHVWIGDLKISSSNLVSLITSIIWKLDAALLCFHLWVGRLSFGDEQFFAIYILDWCFRSSVPHINLQFKKTL